MRWFFPIMLAGCAHSLPYDQACEEVPSAIAYRTTECTGSEELGTSRYNLVEEQFVCSIQEVEGQGQEYYADFFECPLVLRNLACELVDEYGDDIELWLASNDACRAMYGVNP